MNTNTKPQPVDHVRIGAISAAIWENQTENGVRHGVTIERLYRDAESGKWKSSSTFNRDDLLVLAKVADLAHTRVHELQAKSRTQGRDDTEPAESQSTPPAPAAGGASASGRDSTAARAARARSRADSTR